MDPVCIEISISAESPTGDPSSRTYVTQCYAIGLRNFCYWTAIWRANHPREDWDGPGNVDQVLAEFCNQYT